MQEKVEKLFEGVGIARKHNVNMFLQMKKYKNIIKILFYMKTQIKIFLLQ